MEDKDTIADAIKRYPQPVSELTFSNIISWDQHRKYVWTKNCEHIMVCREAEGKLVCYPPVGKAPADIIRRVIKDCDKVKFERVGSRITALLKDLCCIQDDRANADYVYLVENLKEMHGDHFRSKRNFVRRVQGLNPVVEPIGKGNIEEVKFFLDEWCKERKCFENKNLHDEHLAAEVALDNFFGLGLFGVIVKVEGKVEGFAMGEELTPDTFVEHFEKASSTHKGMYQFVLWALVNNLPKGYSYLNREQDLGIDGLRRAKMSYHPSFLTEKYIVQKPSDSSDEST